MLNYVYPNEIKTKFEDKEALKERILEWHGTLRFLYAGLKQGIIPYFYYISDQFSGIFISQGCCGLEYSLAILSRVPSKVKDFFEKVYDGLEYKIGENNTLYFQSYYQMKILQAALIDLCNIDDLKGDVPQLISCVPFLNSTISNTVKINHSGQIIKTKEKYFYFDFQGIILPNNVYNLIKTLSSTLDEFIMNFSGFDLNYFNFIKEDSTDSQKIEFMNSSEYFEFLRRDPFDYKGFVIHTIQKKGDKFLVEAKKIPEQK